MQTSARTQCVNVCVCVFAIIIHLGGDGVVEVRIFITQLFWAINKGDVKKTINNIIRKSNEGKNIERKTIID